MKKYTITKERENIILSMLKKSASPVKSNTIAYTLGVKNSLDTTNSNIRKLIKNLINSGHPIASTTEGYFLVRTNEDLHKFILTQNKKIRQHAIRIDRVLSAYIKNKE